MIVFPFMLVAAAEQAGMKVPECFGSDTDRAEDPDPDTFRVSHPHFFVFCALQLGRRMSSPAQHFYNANVIAAITEDRLKRMTVQDFIKAGVDMT